MANIDKKIRASEKLVKALELRKKGYSLGAIAKEIGFHDGSGVHKLIHRSLGKTDLESAQAFQNLAFLQYQMLTRQYMPRALNGDLKAAWFMVRVIKEECKLLGVYELNKVNRQAPARKKRKGGADEWDIRWEFPYGRRGELLPKDLDTKP